MNKSMLSGIVLGAVVATAGGAIAGYSAMANKTPTHAEVIKVAEIKEQEKTPRQLCRDVSVTRQKPVQDQHQVLGTVAGAVIGGVLGNQVGGGSGKKVATVCRRGRWRIRREQGPGTVAGQQHVHHYRAALRDCLRYL